MAELCRFYRESDGLCTFGEDVRRARSNVEEGSQFRGEIRLVDSVNQGLKPSHRDPKTARCSDHRFSSIEVKAAQQSQCRVPQTLRRAS